MKKIKETISALLIGAVLAGISTPAFAAMIYGVGTKIRTIERDKDGQFLVKIIETPATISACGADRPYPFHAGSDGSTVQRYKEFVAMAMLAVTTKADVALNIYEPDCDIRNIQLGNGL